MFVFVWGVFCWGCFCCVSLRSKESHSIQCVCHVFRRVHSGWLPHMSNEHFSCPHWGWQFRLCSVKISVFWKHRCKQSLVRVDLLFLCWCWIYCIHAEELQGMDVWLEGKATTQRKMADGIMQSLLAPLLPLRSRPMEIFCQPSRYFCWALWSADWDSLVIALLKPDQIWKTTEDFFNVYIRNYTS